MTLIKDIFTFSHKNDPFAIAKHFFNSLSHSDFIDSIERLLNHKHIADEYHSCSFSHDVDYDEETFDGVKFRRIDDELIVNEEVFKSLVKAACSEYLKLYPQNSKRMASMLASNQLNEPLAKIF